MASHSTLHIEEIAMLDKQIDQLYNFKPISEPEVKMLCDKAKEILGKQLRSNEQTRNYLWRYSRSIS